MVKAMVKMTNYQNMYCLLILENVNFKTFKIELFKYKNKLPYELTV